MRNSTKKKVNKAETFIKPVARATIIILIRISVDILSAKGLTIKEIQ